MPNFIFQCSEFHGYCSSLFSYVSTTVLFGQSKGINREKYRINISETNNIINIDGILDEPVWLNADKASHFQRVLPTDTGFAIAQTEVRAYIY